MRHVKTSLALLGFTAAVLPVAALSASALSSGKVPAARGQAPADLYGPLPPPGFVVKAAPPRPVPAAAAAPAKGSAAPAQKSSVASFFQRWIPAWMKPVAPPTGPVAVPSARTAPLPSVPAPRPKLAVAPAAPESRAKPRTDKISLAKRPASGAAVGAVRPSAPASLAQRLATREGKPRLLTHALPAPAKPVTALPAAVKRAPASAAAPSALSAKGAENVRPSRLRPEAPVPTAPALPPVAAVTVPVLQLPLMGTITINRDPLPPIKLSGRNQAELHNFARSARLITMPTRDYGIHRNAEDIAARFADALQPHPHRPIRTPYALHLEKHARIKSPPAPIQYENMVKRLDALFDGLALSYPKAIQPLWELSQARNNAGSLRARDALFAGILAHRAHWESVSGNLLEEAVVKGADREERYLKILFAALEDFEAISHIDRVIAKVNPVRAEAFGTPGDQANYALARRVLLGRASPGLRSELFEARIGSSLLRDRLGLLRSVAQVRAKAATESAALATLRRLESEGHADMREEARIALARVLLQKGEALAALDLYRHVTKTGRNRLEVLSEQSYAELKAGLYQESLGKSVGLQSPYFQYGFSPDIHLIEVLSRKSMCDFGGAEAGLHRFVDRYGRELTALQETLAHRVNPKAYYEELIAYHAKTEPLRYQRYLLRLTAVMENQKVLNGARADLTKVDQVGRKKWTPDRPAGWDQFVAAMEKSWGGRGDTLKVEAAKTALAEADYLAKRLRSSFGQAELLGLDLATSASRNFNLQSALNFPVRKLAANELEKDKFHWPFEQEIWEDELDYLKMKNPSKCAANGARPVASAQ